LTSLPLAPKAPYCVIHEFLTASMFRQLVTHIVQRQGLIKPSERARDAVRVLDELGTLKDPLAAAVLDALPDVAPRCGLSPFDPADVDMQVMSKSNASLEPTCNAIVDDRVIGFVLFLHREPRPFEGGTLHLRSATDEVIIEPSQNSIVFFRSSIAVQTGAVRTSSGALIDSRLTLEGWIRKHPG
jgi:hypothetical protein